MKKILLGLLVTSILSINTTQAQINIQLPTSTQSNQDQIAQSVSAVSSDSNYWIRIVQLANKYLWIILVVVLMAVLIITGFKLMSGENENSGPALMNALIAILIAIFSYVIIRLVINLF